MNRKSQSAPAKRKVKPAADGLESNAIVLDADLDPDAWPKFEKLIKSAAKMGPQPHGKKRPTSQKP